MEQRTRMPGSDGLWRLTMEHSPVGMALVTLGGDFITANRALCEMLGHPLDELQTMSVRDVVHPDDRGLDEGLVARCLDGELASFRVTRRYVRADGSTLLVDLSVSLLRDDDGTPLHFISQMADLSERQAFVERLDAAEAEIESEQAQAHAIFDSVAVGLLTIDAEGRYVSYNRRHEEFLALAFPEGHRGVVGQTGHIYESEDGRPLAREEMPSVRAAAGEEFDGLLVWVGADALKRRVISISARSVRDRSGTHTGSVLAYHDVTDAVHAVRVKDDFVASVSHELRTPLTSALAYLELLDYTAGLPDDVHLHIGAARRNMLRLSHLVADLLFAARATSGSPVVDPYRVDLVNVVREAVEAAEVDAVGAGVEVGSDLPDSVVAVVDGLRLRQALDNLLDNAIAYTPRGGRVRVALDAGEHEVTITISDDGEGLEEAEVQQMFTRFYRGDNARSRQVPGTGLGLSIVRTIVESHGGRVSATSAPGEGTSVTMVLPR